MSPNSNQRETIDQLIINSPYEEPAEHWKYHLETQKFSREQGRRPAGYIRATEKTKSHKDPGVFVELPLVNQIRPRVKKWREGGYGGVTGITKRLLEHWARSGTTGESPAVLLPAGSHRHADLDGRRSFV